MLENSRIRENISLVFLLGMTILFFGALYFLFGREIMFDMILLSVYITSFSLLGVVLIWGIYSNPPAQKLQEEMDELKEAIRTLEQKFFKREISEKSFLKLLNKKHRKLIKIEAKIYKKTSPVKIGGLKASLLKRRERSALKKLLEQKANIMAERKIASCKLYRRQIDNATFHKFVEENDASLVQTDSLIHLLFSRADQDFKSPMRKRVISKIAKKEKIDVERMSRELSDQHK